jgi:hypothetical protein
MAILMAIVAVGTIAGGILAVIGGLLTLKALLRK